MRCRIGIIKTELDVTMAFTGVKNLGESADHWRHELCSRLARFCPC